jgi:hypothetical protein
MMALSMVAKTVKKFFKILANKMKAAKNSLPEC